MGGNRLYPGSKPLQKNNTADVKYRGALTGHSGWVTSIATTYEQSNLVVSGSRDKTAMVWELTPEKPDSPGYARRCLRGHNQAVCDTVISSDGQFALTGSMDSTMRLWDLNTGASVRKFQGHSKDGTAMLWDVNDGKHLYSLEDNSTINAMCFSPKNYWLCAATDTSIKIWDLENKNILDELTTKTVPKSGIPWCVSLQWSADGNTLFAGSTDGHIYVYSIGRQ